MSETHIPYWVEPEELVHLGNTIRDAGEASSSLADIAKSVESQIANDSQLLGLENVPLEGPLIAIVNHPCHFDSLLLGDLYRLRPDLRPLYKTSPIALNLPKDTAVFISKDGQHSNRDDVRAMQEYLKAGGSMLVVPWGDFDSRAYDEVVSLERATQNVIRYASFNGASVLPISIDAEWGERLTIPLRRAEINIHEAILLAQDGLNVPKINQAVEQLYERYYRT